MEKTIRKVQVDSIAKILAEVGNVKNRPIQDLIESVPFLALMSRSR